MNDALDECPEELRIGSRSTLDRHKNRLLAKVDSFLQEMMAVEAV